ncbi:matrilysin isoform X2 [Denticeps clupeoides]|uniref:matrilysin isoform X2 n=1 Tax=Denticeps clupeoides TaxID=299321 RepID=UPI0010A5342F|nr:matrilysin-like isoform X2 [Denticeps clupeoides]
MRRRWTWTWTLLSVVLSADIFWTMPVTTEPGIGLEDIQHAEEYLGRFYNLRTGQGPRSRRHLRTMELKIREMQRFFSLEETGRLNPQTLEAMKGGRCGVPDVENFSIYPGQPKWNNHTITYRIVQYTADLQQREVEHLLQLAFKIWSDAAPLSFVKVNNGEADIVISFVPKVHGDFFPFDGPNGVLAHAFQPGADVGGDVHFDDDEMWTATNLKSGYSLFMVAAHELGHSLGLSHSKDPSALMYPKYKRSNPIQTTLSRDDVQGIQAIYVGQIGDKIVFFKDGFMWMRSAWGYEDTVKEGLQETFLPGVPSPVDAAYDIPAKSITFIFSGSTYWEVRQLQTARRNGSIYDYGFPLTVKHIDAAVHLSEYGKTFFFTGDEYYRYDEGRKVMDKGFPRKIQPDWPGIGPKIDAALALRAGAIHFFSGPSYSSFDYLLGRVTFTLSTSSWLGCGV